MPKMWQRTVKKIEHNAKEDVIKLKGKKKSADPLLSLIK